MYCIVVLARIEFYRLVCDKNRTILRALLFLRVV